MHHLSGIALRRSYLGSVHDIEQTVDGEILVAPPHFWVTLARQMIQGSLDLVSVFDEFCSM